MKNKVSDTKKPTGEVDDFVFIFCIKINWIYDEMMIIAITQHKCSCLCCVPFLFFFFCLKSWTTG